MRNSSCQCPRMGNLDMKDMKVGTPSPRFLQSQSPHGCCSQPMVCLFILLYIKLFGSLFPVSWFPALWANWDRPAHAPAKAVSKPCSLSSRPTGAPAFLCCPLQVSSSHCQLPSLVNQVSFCACICFLLRQTVAKSWVGFKRWTSQGYNKNRKQSRKCCNSNKFGVGCKWPVIYSRASKVQTQGFNLMKANLEQQIKAAQKVHV